jgi:hypothetical protein
LTILIAIHFPISPRPMNPIFISIQSPPIHLSPKEKF